MQTENKNKTFISKPVLVNEGTERKDPKSNKKSLVIVVAMKMNLNTPFEPMTPIFPKVKSLVSDNYFPLVNCT